VSTDDETGTGHDTVGQPTASARRRWRVLAGVVTLVVVVASLLPPELFLGPDTGATPDLRGPLGLVGLDKWLHALGYAVLAGTLVPAVAADRPGRRSLAGTVVVAFAVAAGVGLGVELLQWPHPGRTASLVDAAANLVGAAVGAAVAVVGRR
jgi:VanZ family protein